MPPESQTHHRLRSLRAELRDEGVLDGVNNAVGALLTSGSSPSADKIVKDAVWGIIRIPWYLLPFVDSGLLQRLSCPAQLAQLHPSVDSL